MLRSLSDALPDSDRLDDLLACLRHPVLFAGLLWPDTRFYGSQELILTSMCDSSEVYVTAGNMLGKDFVAGELAYSFVVAPQVYFPASYVIQVESETPTHWESYMRHRRRVVTTSVKDEHMDVLWGEIGQFHRTCVGDPERFLKMTHHELRFLEEVEARNPANYLKGQVSAKGEGLAGHHASYTLVIGDESSGLDDVVQTQCVTWARRALWISNPLPTVNFFYRNVKAGDLLATRPS